MNRYTIEVRRFRINRPGAWKRLSVSSKAEFTRFEVDCHRYQWAADHQENPFCVCARVLKDGNPWLDFPSDAAINAEGVEA